MGVGESIFYHLNAQRESERQYRFDFMPPSERRGPYSLTLETDDATVHVVADDFGRQGLRLHTLRVSALDGPVDDDANGLMALVERIVTEVESPYGPIKCLENDERLTRAVLRTDPTAEGCFFEVIVDGGRGAELSHYTVSKSTRERSRSLANIGETVFGKMADGMAGAFRQEEQTN